MSGYMQKSKSVEWSTPQTLFDELHHRYNFTLDVCASDENAKCPAYYTKREDGLEQTWHGRCWMNPPYGRYLSAWMKKAYDSVRYGDAEMVCCLVPARTDTAWFHKYALQGRIQFLRGRLKFGNSEDRAPFPNMIVIFDKEELT